MSGSRLLFAIFFLFAPTAAMAELTNLDFDPVRSTLVAISKPSGLLKIFKKDHAILAPRWMASVRYDPDRPSSSRVELTVSMSALEFDSQEALHAAHLSRSEPSEEDRRALEAQVCGSRAWDCKRYPDISFKSTTVQRAGSDALVVKGELTVRGVSREIAIPVRVEPAQDETLRVSGEFAIKQSEYGIEPPGSDELHIWLEFFTKARTAVASATSP